MQEPSPPSPDASADPLDEYAALAAALEPAPEPPLLAADAIDRWDAQKLQFATLLRETQPGAEWVKRLEHAADEMLALAARDTDMALYLLVQTAGQDVNQYSAHHAMLCAIVCELAARWLAWTEDERRSLTRAALSMNLSMSATQDALARQIGALSAAQRRQVNEHAHDSAALLTGAGVKDWLWLDAVRLHHREFEADPAGVPPAPAERLANLLHRVDVYTAKLSLRSSRNASSPAIAARDACLNAHGVPDAVGATMLRVLGLYPPGTYVLLASGEVAVVVKRGAKAHTPSVASVRRADGGLFMQPVRRDTADARHAVLRGVAAADVKVRINQWRVLSAA
jgi:HD-GYP domain-containing protein (c-di-GMP phosphodiesterase class II)